PRCRLWEGSMYARVVFRQILNLLSIASMGVHGASAQTVPEPATAEQHQQGASAQEPEHAEPDMQMGREGSGTSWLPDRTPMYAIHWQRGEWQLMAHENAFIQFLHESGDRGDDQFGSINWVMGMAQRKVGNARMKFRGMLTVEPWT